MQQSTELNDILMNLDEITVSCGVERQWVLELIEENIITPTVTTNNVQQFSGYQISTIRRASRLSRDFNASVPAIGLILELLNELEQLRQFKKQFDAQIPYQTIEVRIKE